jgi:hypothetical protein
VPCRVGPQRCTPGDVWRNGLRTTRVSSGGGLVTVNLRTGERAEPAGEVRHFKEQAQAGSVLVKEVLVDALDHIGVLVLYAYVVLNHQAAQSLTVNQDDPGCYPVGIGDGLRGEAASGDEDAPVGLGTVQCPDELLDLWPTHRPGRPVSLGLNVDAIQPERVLADHAV